MNELIINGNNSNMLPNLPSTHFIRTFLDLKKSKSKYTAISYERDIKDFFGVDNIESITLDHIRMVNIFHVQNYILSMQDKGYSSASIARKISSLSALYKWLMKYEDNYSDMRLIKFNPFANVKDEKPTITNKTTEFLTEDETRELLASIDTSTVIGKRNKAIMALAFTTALRKSEMINIKLKNITTYDRYDVIEVTRKGNKKDMVKIQPKVKELIEEYLNATNRTLKKDAESYLFVGHSTNKLNGKKLDPSTLNYMMDKIAKNAGIDKHLKVHSTRHSAITIAITGGATIEKVREFAAHRSISTTNRYIHSIDKLKDNPGDNMSIL